jgi:hypothetical protein
MPQANGVDASAWHEQASETPVLPAQITQASSPPSSCIASAIVNALYPVIHAHFHGPPHIQPLHPHGRALAADR